MSTVPSDEVALVPLAGQPHGVDWPTRHWPRRPTPPAVAALLDELTGDQARYGTTYGVAVVCGGYLVAERYGGVLEHWDQPAETVGPATALLSWSVAKSVLHTAVGLAAGDGLVHPDRRAPVPEWSGPDDGRGAATLQNLLEMRDGLRWLEEYTLDGSSDVVAMLFGEGRSDVAAFAAGRPLDVPPGTRFAYSSGTSNIVSGVLGRAVGTGAALGDWLTDRLWRPLGITSARPGLDDAGTWVASSYLYLTLTDWCRWGLLTARDGVWEGRRLLPGGWVDHGRRHRSTDADGHGYGAHWWVTGDPLGTFGARGYQGQMVTVCPALDTVVARFGLTDDDTGTDDLRAWQQRLLEAVASRA